MFYEQVEESVQYIHEHMKTEPLIGIILGSGLGSLVETMEDKEVFSHQDAPHSPQSKATGHAGNLVFGRIGNQCLTIMQRRPYYYGGFSMREITCPIHVMKLLGARDLIVTNACGGTNPNFKPEDLMITDDLINSLDVNPLIGDNDERLGSCSPGTSESHSIQLREEAEQVADQLAIPYRRDVYALSQGSYCEAAAGIRMYARAGGGATGMSTVPETIVVNYLGIRVLGIIYIINMTAGIARGKHSHEEVVKVANKSSTRLCTWIEVLLKEW